MYDVKRQRVINHSERQCTFWHDCPLLVSNSTQRWPVPFAEREVQQVCPRLPASYYEWTVKEKKNTESDCFT